MNTRTDNSVVPNTNVNNSSNTYGNRIRMQSTNTNIAPEKLMCAQCWACSLVMFGPMVLLPGITLTAVNCCDFDDDFYGGGLKAGVALLCVAGVMILVGTFLIFCIIRPPCCGFSYPEGQEPQLNQAPQVLVAGYSGQPNTGFQLQQPQTYNAQTSPSFPSAYGQPQTYGFNPGFSGGPPHPTAPAAPPSYEASSYFSEKV